MASRAQSLCNGSRPTGTAPVHTASFSVRRLSLPDDMAKPHAADKQSKRTGPGGVRPGAGRPRGRKSNKTIELETAAKKHADDALAALVAVASSGESEAARVSAATAILDRAYGKPRQSLEHSGKDGGPIEVQQVWRFGAREVAF